MSRDVLIRVGRLRVGVERELERICGEERPNFHGYDCASGDTEVVAGVGQRGSGWRRLWGCCWGEGEGRGN